MGKRSVEDVRGIIAEFERSGLRRREFCERRGIPVTTLDYYRHRIGRKAKPRMAKVNIADTDAQPQDNFTLLLANGRRIESSWRFAEAELARLIRVAESA
ncbi:MAG: hypothetical protein ABI833_22110 [Acidobacteriota bacterium]